MMRGRLGPGIAASLIGLLGIGAATEGAGRLLEWHDAARSPMQDRAAQIAQSGRTLSPLLAFALPRLIQPDEVLGYRLLPGTVSSPNDHISYLINPQSFRGPAVALAKPAGTYRIVALGGSTTFGWGVGEQDTYPSLLQELLNRRCTPVLAPHIEVINGGVPGYISAQNALRLEREWVHYQPDAVLVMDGLNDLFAIPADGPGDGRAPTSVALVPSKARQLLLRWYSWSITHSAFARWLDRQMSRWSRYGSPALRESAPESARSALPVSPHAGFPLPVIRVLQANLDHMARVAYSRRFELVILGYPGAANNRERSAWNHLPPSVRPPACLVFGVNEFDPVVNFMGQWVRSRHVPFVDLRPVFARSASTAALYLNDGIHFTREGNTVIANTVFERLFKARCAP